MAFDVKITTKISILDLLAPFTCRGCGHTGELLCECCKNYIKVGGIDISERADWVYAVGYREGVLERLVEEYKYKSVRRTAGLLAELLSDALPELPEDTVIVPLPTISRHIRERGFDHTLLIAKKLAMLRGFSVARVLLRNEQKVQVGADEKTRRAQAARAYKMASSAGLDASCTYVLLDDVWTTGASMEAAREVLMKNGAKRVLGAVIAVGR